MQCNVSGHEMKITFDKKGSSTLLAPVKHWHFFFLCMFGCSITSINEKWGMEYHLLAYFAKFKISCLPTPLCQIVKSKLPNSQVPVTRSAFPSCQFHIAILLFGYFAKMAEPTSPNELPKWASRCSKNLKISGLPEVWIFFFSQFAQTSARKNQTAPIFLFSPCCCQRLPLTFSSFSLSLSLSLSLLYIYLDGSLKLERSPFKIQATS